MIIDLPRFVEAERPYWTRLAAILDRVEETSAARMDLAKVKEFHDLYERASADLAKVATFASERELRRYLESLVARAYGEIHETRERGGRFRAGQWITHTFPQTFRRHGRAFALAVAVTIAGGVFGAAVLLFEPEAKGDLLPFGGLAGDPAKRVADEESTDTERLEGVKTTFAGELMTHNTRVSIFTMALGVTWGIGTILMLFYNGVIIGLVCVDYVSAGQATFLLGWLLPHGSVEIPAILIAGQAGFVLARAIIGSGESTPLRERLRRAARHRLLRGLDRIRDLSGMEVARADAGQAAAASAGGGPAGDAAGAQPNCDSESASIRGLSPRVLSGWRNGLRLEPPCAAAG